MLDILLFFVQAVSGFTKRFPTLSGHVCYQFNQSMQCTVLSTIPGSASSGSGYDNRENNQVLFEGKD